MAYTVLLESLRKRGCEGVGEDKNSYVSAVVNPKSSNRFVREKRRMTVRTRSIMPAMSVVLILMFGLGRGVERVCISGLIGIVIVPPPPNVITSKV